MTTEEGVVVVTHAGSVRLGEDFQISEKTYSVGGTNSRDKSLIVLASRKGVSLIRPLLLPHKGTESTPAVTELEFNTGINQIILNHATSDLTETIELAHDHSLLSIAVSNFDYLYPNTLSTRYRLKGVIDEWVEIGEEMRIPLNRLPIGRYQI